MTEWSMPGLGDCGCRLAGHFPGTGFWGSSCGCQWPGQEARHEGNRAGISAQLFSTSVLSFKKDLIGEDSFQEFQHRESLKEHADHLSSFYNIPVKRRGRVLLLICALERISM